MIEHALYYTIPAALSLLPVHMRGERAVAMLLAIGLQESRFLLRRQTGGPARGFWQFEVSGVTGVLHHDQTHDIVAGVLAQLRYDQMDGAPFLLFALEDNDVLAAAFARCLLYTLPTQLPGELDAADGWDQYVAAWRPGRPRREGWAVNYSKAWALVHQRKEEV